MGYINLPDGLPANVSRAIISLFFRIPRFSMEAAAARYLAADAALASYYGSSVISVPTDVGPRNVALHGYFPLFNGTIPLVTIGAAGAGAGFASYADFPSVLPGSYLYHFIQGAFVGGGSFSWSETSGYPANQYIEQGAYDHIYGHPFPTDPTCIGVNCRRGANAAYLYINLQTALSASTFTWADAKLTGFTGTDVTQTDIAPWSGEIVPIGTVPAPPQAPDQTQAFSYTDITKNKFSFTEAFTNLVTDWDAANITTTDSDILNYVNTGILVTPNVWHHVILSFDMTAGASTIASSTTDPQQAAIGTIAASRMFVAFDRVNLTQKRLSPYWPTGSGDPNAILTPNAYRVATMRGPITSTHEYPFGARPPTDRPDLTQNTYAINKTFDLQQARFAISDATVPAKDAPMGFPAADEYVNNIYDVDEAVGQMWVGQSIDTSDPGKVALFVSNKGKPVAPSVAKAALGDPLICFPKRRDWIKGENKGSLSGDGSKSPTGDFIPPVGTIIPFTPDPVLTGQPVKPTNPKSLG